MQKILRIEPVTFNEWLYILGLAVPMIIVMEIYKFVSLKTSMSDKVIFDFWLFFAGLGIFLFGMYHLENGLKGLAGKIV
ncbi:MAG: hypothetical protein MZV64_24515 [Ignavibacteriales bacterium]|nr:hypothetical protein [Ignavibacteriales bacterium]